jgi:hypothetical protein
MQRIRDYSKGGFRGTALRLLDEELSGSHCLSLSLQEKEQLLWMFL